MNLIERKIKEAFGLPVPKRLTIKDRIQTGIEVVSNKAIELGIVIKDKTADIALDVYLTLSGDEVEFFEDTKDFEDTEDTNIDTDTNVYIIEE